MEILLTRVPKDQPKPEAAPNKRVIITKTGKVIELSDENSETPVANKKQEPSIIEYINNIDQFLVNRTDDNIEYVKAYIGDWINFLMNNKFDKDLMLSIFDAEELRNKTYQVIKKINVDLVPLG